MIVFGLIQSHKGDRKQDRNGQIRKKSHKLAKKERKRFSILTTDMEYCYICAKEKKRRKKDHIHEVFGGRNRQISIRYGFTIPICSKHHDKTETNMEFDKELKRECQEEFEKEHTRDEFLELIDKNYLL